MKQRQAEAIIAQTKAPIDFARAGLAILALGMAMIAAGLNPAYADGIFMSPGQSVQRVSITLNKSHTFNLARAYATVTVGNGEIAETMPLSDRVLYIQGKRIGTTNISLFDTTARLISVIDVEVTPDLGALQKRIQSGIGIRGIRVSSSEGQIVLSGQVPDAVTAERTISLARSLLPQGGNLVNAMQIASAQQVLLKVRFLEVERRAGRELGVNWFVSNQSGTRVANTGLGTVVQSNDGSLPLFQTAATLPSGTQPFGVLLANLVNKGTTVDALVSALETKGLVRRLAEPDLVALSGDTAAFLAGGEYPTPVLQPGGAGGTPVVSIEYKPFGVQLTFTPTVLDAGKINLRLAPSVSGISDYIKTAAGPAPLLTKREARTTIELRDGQSFAIAGLLQSNNRRDISQLPWIGSVPVLGALFSSKSFQQDETDLVVIVTPHLVAPAAPGQQVATPLDQRIPSNDADFFLEGKMELRKEHGDFIAKGGAVRGPYGHIIGMPAVDVKN